MTEIHRAADYLQHMLDAISNTRTFTNGMDKNTFADDLKTQQAVILNILIIGEAATKISVEYPNFISQFPDIPWKQMRGMRNRMVHGYFDTDLDLVWETVRRDLPNLESQILALFVDLNRPE